MSVTDSTLIIFWALLRNSSASGLCEEVQTGHTCALRGMGADLQQKQSELSCMGVDTIVATCCRQQHGDRIMAAEMAVITLLAWLAGRGRSGTSSTAWAWSGLSWWRAPETPSRAACRLATSGMLPPMLSMRGPCCRCALLYIF